MLQIGDKVYVEDSAQIDIGFLAWSYVKSHPYAEVKQRMEFTNTQVCPESERVYALEWPEEFSGGHTCQGACANGRGQFVTYKHLSLDFEGSRSVCTIPRFEGLITK